MILFLTLFLNCIYAATNFDTAYVTKPCHEISGEEFWMQAGSLDILILLRAAVVLQNYCSQLIQFLELKIESYF